MSSSSIVAMCITLLFNMNKSFQSVFFSNDDEYTLLTSLHCVPPENLLNLFTTALHCINYDTPERSLNITQNSSCVAKSSMQGSLWKSYVFRVFVCFVNKDSWISWILNLMTKLKPTLMSSLYLMKIILIIIISCSVRIMYFSNVFIVNILFEMWK